MKKIALWSIGLTLAIVLIGVTLFYFMVNDSSTDADGGDTKEEPGMEQGEADQQEVKEQEEANQEDTEQLADDFTIPPEEEFQSNLHKMTHQKVEADQKWGSLRITDERIDRMLAILTEANYKYNDFYHSVLTAWDNGDFSNAVEAHNRIWKMQNGTVGKAKGLLSEEEEQAYIEKNFE